MIGIVGGREQRLDRLHRKVEVGKRTWRKHVLAFVLIGIWGSSLEGQSSAPETEAATPQAVTAQLPFEHFTPQHRQFPLPSSSVQKIFQDAEGHLWLAFYTSGLSHFKESEVVTYDLEDGLPDPMVREITQDVAGYLWVGTEAGLAVSDQPVRHGETRRLRFLTRIGGVELARSRMRRDHLVRDPAGGVWVTVDGELWHYRRDATGIVAQPVDMGTSDAPVGYLLATRGGDLWVAQQGVGVGRIPKRRGTFEAMAEEAVPTSPVMVLHEGPGGTVWAGCFDGGIWRYEPAEDRFEPVNSQLAESIFSLLETQDGMLWAASLGSGILRMNPDRPDFGLTITRAQGLPSETVWHLFQDPEGTLWVGHNAGLSRLRPNYGAFLHYTGQALPGGHPALPESTVFAIVNPRPGMTEDPLWVGTGGGLAVIDPSSSRAQALTIEQGLMSNSIYSLARDGKGRIWIGTQAGLNVVSFNEDYPNAVTVALGQPVEILGRSATLVSYGLSTIYEIRAHGARHSRAAPVPEASPEDSSSGAGAPGKGLGVWLSGVGGLSGFVEDVWYLFGPSNGLPAAGTFTTAFDERSYLWVGTKDGGVWRSLRPLTGQDLRALQVDPETRRVEGTLFEPVWGRQQGARSNSVRRMVWADGSMFVATPAGVDRLAGEPPRSDLHLDRGNGLGGSNAMGMELDPTTGHLWVAQNQGLAEITTDGKVIRRLRRVDGLIDNEIWGPAALRLDREGNVYLGTPRGLTLYRPSKDSQEEAPD